MCDERLDGHRAAVRLARGVLVAAEDAGVLAHEAVLGHRGDALRGVEPGLEQARRRRGVGGHARDALTVAQLLQDRLGPLGGQRQRGDRLGVVEVELADVQAGVVPSELRKLGVRGEQGAVEGRRVHGGGAHYFSGALRVGVLAAGALVGGR